MRVSDIATKTGLSRQTVYKRIKSKGIDLDELREPKTGHLTAEGERVLCELFGIDQRQPETSTKAADSQGDKSVKETSSLQKENERLTSTIRQLREEVRELQAQVATLEAEKALLIENRETLKTALDRSQQLEMTALQKLPPLLPARTGLFGWLHRRSRRSADGT